VQVQVLLSAPSFAEKTGDSQKVCTEFAQKNAQPDRRVKFPVTIRHRSSKAKIYAPGGNFSYYRLAYTVDGKRRMQTFAAYSPAREAAERIVRELADGSQAAALSATQSRDALAALQRLHGYYQSTGKRLSLLSAVSEFVEVSAKLNGHTLSEAVAGFQRNVASVQRKDIKEAAAEFNSADKPRTKSSEGQRAQLSAKYAYNRQIQLNKFADSFPGHAISDLTKNHLEAFMGGLNEFSAKSRNHYRATVRQFLQWAVRKDYLSTTHRLNEADSMSPEHANTAETQFYTPGELSALLEIADDTMRPLLAIGGLAGLRTAELIRLEWAEVWRVPGHIEITARKSKTRARRLVEICPALSAWLEPFREKADGKLWPFHEITFQQYFVELCQQANITRKSNGLRHGFCTYHFAANANENLTAAQAGNSPAMIHQHYKGLATKADAEKWFTVQTTRPANVIQLAAGKK
jgi:integrase